MGSSPLLHQRHPQNTSLTPPKPQHQRGIQAYGHPQSYPVESQKHYLPGRNGGVIYQFPCKGCNFKHFLETGKALKTRVTQYKAATCPASRPYTV